MLSRLKIVNFLLIDELELNFNSGLTVVTGETGSGKSIIIDALMIVFGAKTSIDVIRVDQVQAIFEAEFSLENKSAVLWLEENDLADADDSTSLLCRRVVDRHGKNKMYVNGNVVTIGQLRQIGDLILDVHTQHASITLLKQDVQRNLLDEYSGLSDKVQQLGVIYKSIAKIEDNIKLALAKNKENELKRIELQRIYDELAELSVKDGEWEDLELSHKQLANAELILRELSFIDNTLDGTEDSVKPVINKLIVKVEKLSAIFPKSTNLLELLTAVAVEMQEAIHEVSHLASKIEQNSDKLVEVELRINAIFDTARKYKINPEYVWEYIKELEYKLNEIDRGIEVEQLNKDLLLMRQEYSHLASIITHARNNFGAVLSGKITELLHQLAIRGEFKIELISQFENRVFGVENVEYKVSFNKGLDLQPLAKVASGGELSRTALALYLLLSIHNPPEVIVFDEVDVGIGGKVAASVGKMLQELGNSKQVICITHQPQTASYGDNHLVVNKVFGSDRVTLSVSDVVHEERVLEIARMLSGIEVTEATISHAKELLNVMGN